MSASATDWAEETEQRLLDAALELAPELGFGPLTVRRAAAAIGLSEADAELLVPHGGRDLAALLSRRHDARTLDALKDVDPRLLKMRERIVRAVQARLGAAGEDAATRRWAGFLALPSNVALGLRLAWDSADVIWRWAGDDATDENHYTKRATLAGILLTALPLRLSAGAAEADRYVQDRVSDIMRFERWKGGLPQGDLGPKLAAALGRLRYR